MFKFRNLLGVTIATVMMVILMTAGASAHPALQDTATPEATTITTDTPAPTAAATDTPAPTIAATVAATSTVTPTAVAPAVSPLATPSATPVSTPSTLPTTGGSDDGSAALSLLLVVAGAVILVGVLGVTLSRRSR